MQGMPPVTPHHLTSWAGAMTPSEILSHVLSARGQLAINAKLELLGNFPHGRRRNPRSVFRGHLHPSGICGAHALTSADIDDIA